MKFNFVPLYQIKKAVKKKKEESQFATFNPKTGQLTFSKGYIISSGIAGRFLKFYIDGDKKALAWQVIADKELMKYDNKIRKVAHYGSTYVATIPKENIIEYMNLDRSKTFKKRPVGKYTDGKMIGEVYYITLKHTKDHEETEEN